MTISSPFPAVPQNAEIHKVGPPRAFNMSSAISQWRWEGRGHAMWRVGVVVDCPFGLSLCVIYEKPGASFLSISTLLCVGGRALAPGSYLCRKSVTRRLSLQFNISIRNERASDAGPKLRGICAARRADLRSNSIAETTSSSGVLLTARSHCATRIHRLKGFDVLICEGIVREISLNRS